MVTVEMIKSTGQIGHCERGRQARRWRARDDFQVVVSDYWLASLMASLRFVRVRACSRGDLALTKLTNVDNWIDKFMTHL